MLLSVLLIPFVQCLGYRVYDPGFSPLFPLPFFLFPVLLSQWNPYHSVGSLDNTVIIDIR